MDEAMVSGLAERLEFAVTLLEGAVARMDTAGESVGRIVATVESAREAELERKLADAEARIAELSASASAAASVAAVASGSGAGRKTVSAGTVAMLSKQGVALDGIEAGAVDAALASLSIEQRIAVKSELLRAGVLR